MGIKKITRALFQRWKWVNNFNKKVIVAKSIWLTDLKHDLENQLIKISQKLEFLRRRWTQSDKNLQQQYQELCEQNPLDIANAMTFIDRTVYQMFCEVACITVLDWESENINKYKDKHIHVVHKIVLRLLLLYSDELSKNNIRYNLCESENKWNINQDIFSAIILKIIQNCTKYCMPSSTIKIAIEENEIKFSMKSLKIEHSEKMKIFESGISWKHAVKLWKGSSWKGLFHAKELAKFHELEIQVIPWIEAINFGGSLYSDNEFIIKKL